MSTGLITIRMRFCMYELVQALADIEFRRVDTNLDLRRALTGRLRPEREREARRLAALRALQKKDPNLDVQLVTDADGVCRIVARRLGVWGCGCETCERRRTLAGGGAGSSACAASGESGAGTETDRAPLPSVKAPPAGPGAASPVTGRPAGGGDDA